MKCFSLRSCIKSPDRKHWILYLQKCFDVIIVHSHFSWYSVLDYTSLCSEVKETAGIWLMLASGEYVHHTVYQ